MLRHPPMDSSTALVLVPGGSSSALSASPAQGNTNATDSEIAITSAVLGPAGSSLHPALSFDEAKKRVTATAVGTNLVQITASGSTPAQADALANAVANRLVEFATTSSSSLQGSALAGLQAEAAQVTKQLNSLDAEIKTVKANIAASGSTTSSDGNLALLATLTTAASDAGIQLQGVDSQIAAAQLDIAAANGGTEVVQKATAASPPPLLHRILPIVGGAVIGFLIGLGYLLVRRRKGVLVTRDQIAEAVGGSVLLSTTVGRWHRASNWLDMLRSYTPSTTERWNVIKAMTQLDAPPDGRLTLTVVTFAQDTVSMAALAQLAVTAAAMDIRTSIVCTSDDEGSQALRDACDLLAARGEAPRPSLTLYKGPPPIDDVSADLTIVSVVVDPAQPKLPPHLVSDAVVLAIPAGRIEEVDVARALIAVSQAGLSAKGAFVINPVVGDRTTGLSSGADAQVQEVLRRRPAGVFPEARAQAWALQANGHDGAASFTKGTA